MEEEKDVTEAQKTEEADKVKETTEANESEVVDEKVQLATKKDTLDVKELDEEKIEKKNVDKRLKEHVLNWNPKTALGKRIKAGEEIDVDEIFSSGKPILEVAIIDTLFPDLESELLLIGQSKGKFGGGARRVFKQTQKKTKEGNKPSFATMAVVGNRDGFVGVGYAKSKETVPAREKALRRAKINLFKVKRGSGSWLSSTNEPHTIPFSVEGRCGSVRIKLMPAPVGKGLIIEKECQKILELAGIKDIWSRSSGKTKTKINLIKACVEALKKMNNMKSTKKKDKELSIISGGKGAQ